MDDRSTSRSGSLGVSWSLFVGAVISSATIAAAAVQYWHQKRRNQSSPDVKTPLRNVTPRDGEASRIVYLTGIDKQTTQQELIHLFSIASHPLELDLSEVTFAKTGGRAWAHYGSAQDARRTIHALHQTRHRGCVLCCRLELGARHDGTHITDSSSHTALVRGIQTRRGTPKQNKQSTLSKKGTKNTTKKLVVGKSITTVANETENRVSVTYSHRSISVGETEYPFPSGVYLTKLIQRLTSLGRDLVDQSRDHLLDLLSDVSKIGGGSTSKYTKELSEAMAMVDALERAIKKVYGVGVKDLGSKELLSLVTCYCLGDGTYPVSAAALALFLPIDNRDDKLKWKFVAIDPLLKVAYRNDDDDAASNPFDPIECYRGLSQDYQITSTTTPGETLSIAIACHSHAPLEEFWKRMSCPKLCVAMPCCAQFSELPTETPILEYDDHEVYSPKRRLKVFASF